MLPWKYLFEMLTYEAGILKKNIAEISSLICLHLWNTIQIKFSASSGVWTPDKLIKIVGLQSNTYLLWFLCLAEIKTIEKKFEKIDNKEILDIKDM